MAFGFDETITDFDLIEKAIKDFQPKMITLVQNETPSGTMNPVKEIGDLKVKYDVPLLCVDIVSGLGDLVLTLTVGTWTWRWAVHRNAYLHRRTCHFSP